MPVKPTVLQDRYRNRGTAYTPEERAKLGITGRLPAVVESLEEQANRAYAQLMQKSSDLQKYIYLNEIHDRNQVLYFKLLADHLDELLPVVYDPTVGDAIQQWSVDYRDSRAVYLSIDRPEDVKRSFESLGLGADDVDLIVVSDAQEILGIGDWGVNGTDISIGKLAVYTAAAGIDPNRVIAVNLDVGTDNEQLLNSPPYLGNRHARVTGKRYDDFISLYLQTVSELFPHALLHFEDFGPSNARRILVENADKYRIFNDDMQGTGAIVMASVFSALKVTGARWSEQRLVVFGAGTAGTGMADQIHAAMVRDGATPAQAKSNIWLIDVHGLVTDDMADLPDYQRAYARPKCPATHLKVSAENVDTGAGTTHFQLLFQNTGSNPCTLNGFPGVSFHGADGTQIGNAAARDNSTSVTMVTLLPNGHAASDVTAPNGQSGFSASQCRLKDVSFVGVFAPGSKDLIDVPWQTQECSSTSIHALEVGPIHSVR